MDIARATRAKTRHREPGQKRRDFSGAHLGLPSLDFPWLLQPPSRLGHCRHHLHARRDRALRHVGGPGLESDRRLLLRQRRTAGLTVGRSFVAIDRVAVHARIGDVVRGVRHHLLVLRAGGLQGDKAGLSHLASECLKVRLLCWYRLSVLTRAPWCEDQIDAVGQRDRIISYFEANPKAAPIQLVLPALYASFSKIYSVFGMSDKSEAGLRPHFYNNAVAVKNALETIRQYNYAGIERILLLLHHYNLKGVGVGDTGTSDASLMREMVVKMIVQ